MSEIDRQAVTGRLSLPECAAILAEWNHKDTSRSTIERLAKVLDAADADIGDDDLLRVRTRDPRTQLALPVTTRVDPVALHRATNAGAAQQPPPATFLPSQAAYLLDPDKAQAAREALRAHRRPQLR